MTFEICLFVCLFFCLEIDKKNMVMNQHWLILKISILDLLCSFLLIYEVVRCLNDFWNLFVDKVYLENEKKKNFPEAKFSLFNFIF